jgi:putative FmdB family regulatory protein
LPIYEYQCPDCNTVFDRRQSYDEEPVASCPKCQAKARRVIHSVPILFKGSGFYCTDHGRGSRTIESRRDGDSEDTSKVTPEATSDTKPESKTEKPADTAAVTD